MAIIEGTRSVPDLVRTHRDWAPDRPAVIDVATDPPRTWTWQQLAEQAERIGGLYRRLGVPDGGVVAVKLPNQGEAVVAALATLAVGAAVCPLLPGLGTRETRLALHRSGAQVLVTAAPEPPLPVAQVVLDGTADRDHRWHRYADALAVPAGAGAGRASPDGAGLVTFTSGTTGEAKCVAHRVDTLSRAVRLAADRLRLTRSDRVYVPCPLGHHSGSLYGMWLAWTLGCTQILPGRWEPARALTHLTDWAASFTQLAPAMLGDLLRAVERGGPPPPRLRVSVVTGAAVPDGLAERASRALGTIVCRAWGSTETCMATLADPADPPALRWQTDGRPLPGVRLRVDPAGRLEVRSPCQSDGYGLGPVRDRVGFTRDGWYRTGDLASLDAAGYLRVTGRTSDVVNRGGQKIPARTVEGLLAEHPAVAEVAIVATPDPRLGERACAFVVPAPGPPPDLADLRGHLQARGVTRLYWPERLELVPRLPRNAAGKVLKAVLRDSAGTTREVAAGAQ